MLTCLVLLLFLIAIQQLTGRDLSGFTNQVLGFMITLLGAGAVKYSVLKTSERETLNGGPASDDYSGAISPEDFNPGYKRPTKQ